MPAPRSGTELHVAVYGISERDHIEIQRRRDDLSALFAYLGERELLFAINHVFSGLTGARAELDYDEFAERFPAVEILNGQMLPIANRHAEAFAARHRKIALAGSDSHTLAAPDAPTPGCRALAAAAISNNGI